MINRILQKVFFNYEISRENKYYNSILDFNNIDFNEVYQKLPNRIKKISFIIPGMHPYSGGHTSILRLGTFLKKFGYEIYYISYLDEDINRMKKNALLNLNNYEGTILDKSYLKDLETDIAIATYWESVYYLKDINSYKMYFVQDYEPYFYTYGEKYLMAKKTYEMGLHMVSLGKWNKYMIENNCSNIKKLDYIDFPYEKKEYCSNKNETGILKNNNEVNIAVYIKFDEKRAPYLIQIILNKVKSKLESDNIKLNIFYFGIEKKYKLNGGKNLGKLNKNQLCNLYKKCDFGMVASLTNISLVPYEMIAMKLPVIEFYEGSFKYFFDEGSAILTDFNWTTLYNKLKYAINNSEYIKEITEKAYKQIEGLSWEKSAAQFKNILKNEVIK